MTTIKHEVPVAGGVAEIRGALEIVGTETGVVPRRLPEWTRAQYPADSGMERMARSFSGVRLAFRTTARVVELEMHTLVPVVAPDWRPGDAPPETTAGFVDVCVDGRFLMSVPAPVGDVTVLEAALLAGPVLPGRPGTARIDDLPPGQKDVELWLPQWVAGELLTLRADAEILPPTPAPGPHWLHHGSSISQNNGADSPTTTWPAQVARTRAWNLTNVGLAGNCYLDPFVARSLRAVPADLISLKLGINLTGHGSFDTRSFAPAVHGFLDLLRDTHPTTPILVVSPIACPTRESTPARSGANALTLQIVRTELSDIVTTRAAADPHLTYLDGLRLLGADETHLLKDGVHPTQAGNDLIAERFANLAWGETTGTGTETEE